MTYFVILQLVLHTVPECRLKALLYSEGLGTFCSLPSHPLSRQTPLGLMWPVPTLQPNIWILHGFYLSSPSAGGIESSSVTCGAAGVGAGFPTLHPHQDPNITAVIFRRALGILGQRGEGGAFQVEGTASAEAQWQKRTGYV